MFYIPVLSLANMETVVMHPNSCIIREGYMKGFFQMKFNEQINYYIETFDCTAKELCDSSGFSPATLSRTVPGKELPMSVLPLSWNCAPPLQKSQHHADMMT